MLYDVILTDFAQHQLDNILKYTATQLKNEQAVNSILDDLEMAIQNLERNANIYAPCNEPELAKFGYYRYHLKKHRYLLLYRIIGENVFIDRIFHELQDYQYLV